jgi:hypothetical protein
MNRGRKHLMKRNTIKPISVLVLIVSLPLFSCATTQQVEQKKGDSVVDVGNYTVKVPPEYKFPTGIRKGWEINLQKEKETVTFLGPIKINITVSRHVLDESKWRMSEEEIVGSVADSQTSAVEKIVRESADRSIISKTFVGSTEVQFVNKSVDVLDGKRLHTLHFRLLAGGDAVFRTIGFEKKQFIYFQPDFVKSHTLYIFSVSKTYPRSMLARDSYGLGEQEVMLIHDVINSLEYK